MTSVPPIPPEPKAPEGSPATFVDLVGMKRPIAADAAIGPPDWAPCRHPNLCKFVHGCMIGGPYCRKAPAP